jgi:ribose-phosphate pyrophosphokinase
MGVMVHCFADEQAAAGRLAAALGAPLGVVRTHRYPDGEIAPRVPEADETVIAYRGLDRPNGKLVELLLAADAWRRRGVRRLVLAAPYLCYMRQDAVFAPGEPLSQTVIAGLLAQAFDRIVTVDAHLHRTPRISDLPGPAQWTNVAAAPAIGAHVAPRYAGTPPLVVGPDSESGAWTAAVAAQISAPWATLSKTRQSDTRVVLTAPTGVDLAGRSILLVDDICSSGGTLEAALGLLAAHGAGPMDVVVTHALFDEQARLRLVKAGARDILSTDSCAHPAGVIPLAGMLAGALAEEYSR